MDVVGTRPPRQQEYCYILGGQQTRFVGGETGVTRGGYVVEAAGFWWIYGNQL